MRQSKILLKQKEFYKKYKDLIDNNAIKFNKLLLDLNNNKTAMLKNLKSSNDRLDLKTYQAEAENSEILFTIFDTARQDAESLSTEERENIITDEFSKKLLFICKKVIRARKSKLTSAIALYIEPLLTESVYSDEYSNLLRDKVIITADSQEKEFEEEVKEFQLFGGSDENDGSSMKKKNNMTTQRGSFF